MKQKKNSNIINCFKKSFQILKDIIEKINQFKQLAKKKKNKNPTMNNKKKCKIIAVIFKTSKNFNRKQVKKDRKKNQFFN